jgi:hypothetical protein
MQQIAVGHTYTFNLKNTATGQLLPLAQVVVTQTTTSITLGTNAAYTAPANQECWYVDTANLGDLGNSSYSVVGTSAALGSSVSVSSSYAGNGSGSTPYLNVANTATWSSTAPAVPSGTTACYYEWTNALGGPSLWMRWDRIGVSREYGLHQVVWYYMSSTAPTSPLAPTDTFASKSAAPAAPFQTSIS